jgi:hypothetical protein
MPRYYFDIREGTKFIPDESGEEFDSLDGAEFMAARTAAEVGRGILLVRSLISPASSSATASICRSVNLPAGPSIFGRSQNRTSRLPLPAAS